MILQHVKTDCKNVGKHSIDLVEMSNPMAKLIAEAKAAAKAAAAKAAAAKTTPTPKVKPVNNTAKPV
jgi:hypothetical protein